MILLKNLQLNNFLSHKDTKIDFPENAQLSIEGVSGSGKSSIVDGIIWALFGRGRSDNRNLIYRGAKNATVTLELLDGPTIWTIERSINAAGKQSIAISSYSTEGGVVTPLPRTGLKDHQDWLENEFLKSSYTLFINSIAYPQETTESFVKQTAGKRKDLLLEITRAADYDALYTKARDKAQLVSEEILRNKVELEGAAKIISEEKPRIKDESVIQKRVDSLTKERNDKNLERESINEKNNEYNSLKQKRDMATMQLNQHNENITRADQWIFLKQKKITELSSIDKAGIDTNVATLKELRFKLEEYEAMQQQNSKRQIMITSVLTSKPAEFDHDTNINSLNKQIIEVMTHQDGPCPDGKHCRCFKDSFASRINSLEKMINDATQQKIAQKTAMEEYNRRLAEIPAELGNGNLYATILQTKREIEPLLEFERLAAEYESRGKMISELKEEIAGMNNDIGNFKNTIENIKNSIIKIDDSISEINPIDLRVKYTSLNDEIEDLNNAISQELIDLAAVKVIKDRVQKSEDRVKELKSILESKEEELECLALAKEAFGSKGIKTIMIDYLLPRLEDSINDILGQLSEFRIKLETQKQAVDGESVVDGLFISIFNEEGEEFDFSNYSGGQKLKISVAISEALASIQYVGFRIFDEIFVGLDEASVDSFGSVMQSLQARFPQILCISHLRLIKDRFENKILVNKGDKGSVVTYV